MRISDGVQIATLANDGQTATFVQISPDGRYVVVGFDAARGPVVFRTADGARIGELPIQKKPLPGSLAFDPRGDRLAIRDGQADSGLSVFELVSGGAPTKIVTSPFDLLLGFSDGCPVLQERNRGVWRSCAGAEEQPIVSSAERAVLSPDGNFLATSASQPGPAGVTVWSMRPGAAPLGFFEPRPGAYQEFPIALTSGGRRLLTGAYRAADSDSCLHPSDPHLFDPHLLDTGTGALVDAFPFYPSAVDAEARTVVSSTGGSWQLWCAR
jgi:hypothetical protein